MARVGPQPKRAPVVERRSGTGAAMWVALRSSSGHERAGRNALGPFSTATSASVAAAPALPYGDKRREGEAPTGPAPVPAEAPPFGVGPGHAARRSSAAGPIHGRPGGLIGGMDALALPVADFALLAAIVFAAGLVRGYAGFALSALVMAAAIPILPPRALIPICWILEMTASLLMVRGGFREADRRVALTLALTSAAGTPAGLWLTTRLPVEDTRVLALGVLLVLSAMQLARIRMGWLATNAGLVGTGVVAGVVTGIASIGGMVVALYVLAQEAPARVMRASLVLFLFASSFLTLLWQSGFGLFDGPALARGLALAPVVAAGVLIGKATFRPALEPYYKPFALCLLIGLAGTSLIRAVL